MKFYDKICDKFLWYDVVVKFYDDMMWDDGWSCCDFVDDFMVKMNVVRWFCEIIWCFYDFVMILWWKWMWWDDFVGLCDVFMKWYDELWWDDIMMMKILENTFYIFFGWRKSFESFRTSCWRIGAIGAPPICSTRWSCGFMVLVHI